MWNVIRQQGHKNKVVQRIIGYEENRSKQSLKNLMGYEENDEEK